MNPSQQNSLALLFSYRFFERLAFYSIVALLMKMLIPLSTLDSSQNFVMIYSIFYSIIVVSAILSAILGDFKNRPKIILAGFIVVLSSLALIMIISLDSFFGRILLIPLGFGFGMIGTNTRVLLGDIYLEKEEEIKALPGFIILSIIIDIAILVSGVIKLWFTYKEDTQVMMILIILELILAFILFMFFKKGFNKIERAPISTDLKYESTNHKYLNGYILSVTLILALVFTVISNMKSMILSTYLWQQVDILWPLQVAYEKIDTLFSVLLMGIFLVFILIKKSLNWKIIFQILAFGAATFGLAYTFSAFFDFADLFQSNTVNILLIIGLIVLASTLVYPIISYIIYRSAPQKHKGLFMGVLSAIYTLLGTSIAFNYQVAKIIGYGGLFVIIAITAIILVFVILKIIKSIEQKQSATDIL